MKNRGWLTNLLYIVILASLAGFLVVEFNVFSLETGVQKLVATALLAVAIVSVLLVEVVFPLIANRDMLRNTKYVLLAVIKTILFLASAAVLFLYEPLGIIKNMTVALILFVVLYFIQFFISLDPKVQKTKTKKVVIEDEDEDEDDDEVPESDDSDFDDLDDTTVTEIKTKE